ncbi:MAG: acetyltransferase [Proteobacteria bacterium]|nr:acetyltransferase [Pseudomonadota bacterium]MBU1418753.1 acetyltransferase [Pseudomonadota bacterium]MBU1455483.1 acetyltransferase [Pseudomonadota bacterium]
MQYIGMYNHEESVTLGIWPTLAPNASVRDSNFGRYTEVRDFAELIESSLDDYSYVMERSSIAYSDIGKFVNIASDVRINPGNHPMEWVSQHHCLYRRVQYGFAECDDEEFFSRRRQHQVHIGHDVWIGHGATIMGGISIGNGAVIGAGAVVTHDVAPYTIVAGVPEKELRLRFPHNIQTAIERIAWWDWDHETLKKRMGDFHDIHKFLSLYGPEIRGDGNGEELAAALAAVEKKEKQYEDSTCCRS